MAKPLLLLIDGHSLAFRAYYAFTKSRQGALRTATGIPTSVCFGFLNSLLQAISTQKPELVAIAFDRSEPTFRHQSDPQYKANRRETPEDFIVDLNNLQELLVAFNFQIFSAPGYEADDAIATLAEQASQKGYQVKILSGDKDLFQLVDREKQITVLYLDPRSIKSSTLVNNNEFDPAAVTSKMGIKPEQVVDYKALCGDKSDNIPGVLGIGDKTAVKLLQEYGDLDTIYQNLAQIKGAISKKLLAGQEAAKHSRFLAKIITDVPIDIELENCQLQGFDLDIVQPVLTKLELKTFRQQIQQIQQQLGGKLPETSQQLSLFDTVPQNSTSLTINPQIITTEEQLNKLIKLLQTTEPYVAWDTETTSVKALDAHLVGIGCCWGNQPHQIAYIPLNHSQGEQLPLEQVLTALRPLLERKDYPKVLQNTKYDRLVFLSHGIKLAGAVFDTMLASYLLHPEHSHNLTDLSLRYLSGIVAQSYTQLEIPKNKTIAALDIATVANYCGTDTYTTFLLAEKLAAQLEKIPELDQLFSEVELPLEPVLAEMENQGIRIDTDYLNSLSQEIQQNLQVIEKQAYQAAGEDFNLGSPKQLSEILFEQLGLDKRKSRKTKTGYSTDHATLEKLRGEHPIIDHILEYRTLAKLKSTYVDALPALVRSDTQRVHTDFNQAVTTTGRLSSSNPNLQNIPIRTEFSRQIRQAFIPENDWLLVAADYSQIELRILAHLSKEEVLLSAYQNNQDVHRVTAQILFDKEDITDEERRLGKIINFGVIYGMGAQRFARESGISAEIGKEFIAKYRQKYAKVFEYLERVKKEAIANGFVTTILGRRRYFDFASNSLVKLKGKPPETIDLEQLKYSYSDAQLLRAAANSPIQGSSADIIKIAMVKLAEILKDYQARLLLQVHDELIFEIPPQEWGELQDKIKATMEQAVTLDVPLVVEIHAGKNWMKAK